MKKNFKNSLALASLAGSLLFSGCATPTYWTQYSVQGQPTYEKNPFC